MVGHSFPFIVTISYFLYEGLSQMDGIHPKSLNLPDYKMILVRFSFCIYLHFLLTSHYFCTELIGMIALKRYFHNPRPQLYNILTKNLS